MKKRYIVLISIFVLLLVIRLILPYVAKSYINKELANIEGYHGSINDLSMSLYKGEAYSKEIENAINFGTVSGGGD